MSLDGRNTLMGMAARVHKNLAFISESRKKGADVHVVTQLLLSLLGLIVFPVETIKENKSDVLQSTLRDLEEAGWPHWTFTIGQITEPVRSHKTAPKFGGASARRLLMR